MNLQLLCDEALARVNLKISNDYHQALHIQWWLTYTWNLWRRDKAYAAA